MHDELVTRLRSEADFPYNDNRNLLREAADAIEELSGRDTNVPRWIPVTERLPDVYEEVLLHFQQNRASGFWDGGCWCVYSGDGFYTEVWENEGKPTHWAKKLPEPPKEE